MTIEVLLFFKIHYDGFNNFLFLVFFLLIICLFLLFQKLLGLLIKLLLLYFVIIIMIILFYRYQNSIYRLITIVIIAIFKLSFLPSTLVNHEFSFCMFLNFLIPIYNIGSKVAFIILRISFIIFVILLIILILLIHLIIIIIIILLILYYFVGFYYYFPLDFRGNSRCRWRRQYCLKILKDLPFLLKFHSIGFLKLYLLLLNCLRGKTIRFYHIWSLQKAHFLIFLMGLNLGCYFIIIFS